MIIIYCAFSENKGLCNYEEFDHIVTPDMVLEFTCCRRAQKGAKNYFRNSESLLIKC